MTRLSESLSARGLAQLRRPLRFGPGEGIELPGRVGLAPLAGVSEQIFRLICGEHGSAFAVTELVSARGLVYSGLEKSWRYLALHPEEGPVAIQLFGSEPEDYGAAVRLILAEERLAGEGSPLVGFDINMGCPVEKVVKTGAGAALMEDPQRVRRIVAAIREALAAAGREELAVTAKIRLGFAQGVYTAPAIVRALVEAGVDLVAIHGRTRAQMYRGEADLEGIRAAIEAGRDASVRVRTRVRATSGMSRHLPFIANGDVDSVAAAVDMLEQTGADGVMIGRAAEGNPWIFELADRVPEVETRVQVVRRHAEGLMETLGEERALREFRKTLIRYLQGTREAARLRQEAVQIRDRAGLERLLQEWLRLNA